MYLQWRCLAIWGPSALPFEVLCRYHLRSFGAAIRGPWSKPLGTKSRTNIFKFLGSIDHSDQNELYHTPLLSKIWELINKKRCKTIQLSHMSSPDHWGGAWTKGRPLADHGRRLQESQPTVWASGFFCQSLQIWKYQVVAGLHHAHLNQPDLINSRVVSFLIDRHPKAIRHKLWSWSIEKWPEEPFEHQSALINVSQHQSVSTTWVKSTTGRQ